MMIHSNTVDGFATHLKSEPIVMIVSQCDLNQRFIAEVWSVIGIDMQYKNRFGK
jgi:hypothetical protein